MSFLGRFNILFIHEIRGKTTQCPHWNIKTLWPWWDDCGKVRWPNIHGAIRRWEDCDAIMGVTLVRWVYDCIEMTGMTVVRWLWCNDCGAMTGKSVVRWLWWLVSVISHNAAWRGKKRKQRDEYLLFKKTCQEILWYPVIHLGHGSMLILN